MPRVSRYTAESGGAEGLWPGAPNTALQRTTCCRDRNVAQLLGNSLKMVESTYAHLAPDYKRAAVRKLSGAVQMPLPTDESDDGDRGVRMILSTADTSAAAHA